MWCNLESGLVMVDTVNLMGRSRTTIETNLGHVCEGVSRLHKVRKPHAKSRWHRPTGWGPSLNKRRNRAEFQSYWEMSIHLSVCFLSTDAMWPAVSSSCLQGFLPWGTEPYNCEPKYHPHTLLKVLLPQSVSKHQEEGVMWIYWNMIRAGRLWD